MPSLVEIAEREAETGGVVLIDSSVFDIDSLLDIGKYKQHSNLSKGLLQKEKKYTKEFLSFIEKENVFTVEEMLNDFESLYRAISDKQESFRSRQKKIPKKYRDDEKIKQQELLLQNILDNVYKIVIKLKIFQPDDSLYLQLYKGLPHCFNEDKSLSFLKQDYKKYRELLTSIVYLSMKQKLVTCAVDMFKERDVLFKEKLEKIIDSFKSISILKSEEVVSFSLQPDYIRLYLSNRHLNNRHVGFLLKYSTKNEKPA